MSRTVEATRPAFFLTDAGQRVGLIPSGRIPQSLHGGPAYRELSRQSRDWHTIA